MAITTLDQLVDALANNASRVVLDKANLANQTAGRYCSLWRATGIPAQGAIPTTSALCTNATVGAVQFAQQTAPATSYLGILNFIGSNNGQTVEVHDRIAHMGGLSLNVNTAQTVTGLDILTLAPGADRIGDPTYGDLQWWLDVYADGGATASNATINVTYNDGTTGNLNVIAVGGTLRAGRSISLTPFIPNTVPAKFIRGINSVILSASTGTAGNFGFTARCHKGKLPMSTLNLATDADWARCRLAEFPNDACMEFMVICSTTSTGAIRGEGDLLHLTP